MFWIIKSGLVYYCIVCLLPTYIQCNGASPTKTPTTTTAMTTRVTPTTRTILHGKDNFI